VRSSAGEEAQRLADRLPIRQGNEQHRQIGGKGHPQPETTDNPAIKTVIPSARHSPFTAFGPPFCVLLFSSLYLDSMGSAVVMEDFRRNRTIQTVSFRTLSPYNKNPLHQVHAHFDVFFDNR
jgi:hypothetical protein